jgi:hypothetical protein
MRLEQHEMDTRIKEPSYLLDTSAFRGLSSAEIASKAGDCLIHASPYVFWETLCHLDDIDDFQRETGQVLKFRDVNILDDPTASILKTAPGTSASAISQLPDYDIIYACLAALRSAQSIEDFYSSYIQDSSEQIRLISGCVERVCEVLAKAEQQYLQFVDKIIAILDENPQGLDQDDAKVGAIESLFQGWLISNAPQLKKDEPLMARLLSQSYVYHSYIIHRAIHYHANHISPNPNDYEDANICLHLSLDTPYTLVTADKGMLQSVRSTLSLLDRRNDPGQRSSLQVVSMSEFRKSTV